MNGQTIKANSPALKEAENKKSNYSLEYLGFRNLNNIFWNLSVEALYKEADFRNEGNCPNSAPMEIDTGNYKSLAINDRFIVRETQTEDDIDWGLNNRPFSPDKFDLVYYRLLAFLQKRDLFVTDGFAGTDSNYQQPLRVITENGWQSLFAKNMLISPDNDKEIKQFVPEFTILSVPSFQAQSEIDGTISDAFVIINFERKLALIGGTAFAGEIKNLISTIINYLLPLEDVLPINCFANIGEKKDTALFLGINDKTKLALMSDSERQLIGASTIGWCDEGLFNINNALYSRIGDISSEKTSEIFACRQKSGTIIENGETPNEQISCSIKSLENAFENKTADHPKNIFLFSYDSLGVLPLISKLTPDQATYHFMSGYTADTNGEKPEIKFDSCFGESLLVRSPYFYAEKLRNKIKRYNVNCWLINTGWAGGQQIEIETIKSIIKAVLDNKLMSVEYQTEPVFGFEVPRTNAGVDDDILNPENNWPDKKAFKTEYLRLAGMFIENLKKIADQCPSEIVKAGPEMENN